MKLHTVVEKHCHRGWAVVSHPTVDPSTRQVRWGLNKYFDIILVLISFESTVFFPFPFDVYFHDDSWSHISHCVCACSFQAKSQVRSKQPNCAVCVKWCLLTVTCKGPWTPHVCDCSVQAVTVATTTMWQKKLCDSVQNCVGLSLISGKNTMIFFFFPDQVRLLLHQTETEICCLSCTLS